MVFIISKIFMIGMVSISFFTLQFTVKMPYFERKKNVSFTVFNGILHLGIAAFVIFFVKGFFWNPLSGFKFTSVMIAGNPASDIFERIVLLVVPVLAMLISIYKVLRKKV